MQDVYFDTIIASALDILNNSFSIDAKESKRFTCSEITPMLGVVIIIGLVGDASGRVILDMSQDTALKIATIMNEEELSEFDKLASSTLTELSNIIVGNAVTNLHELGYKLDITPPALLLGDNLKFTDKDVEAQVVQLDLSIGIIEINIALK